MDRAESPTSLEIGAGPDESAKPVPAGVYAAAMAIFYCAVATVYIFVSSRMAGGAAASVEELERLEIIKGVVFVVVTAIAMFGFNFVLMRRLRRQQIQILQHERIRNTSEKVALAGTFAGAIAHDINNALTVATLATQELTSRNDLLPEQRSLAEEISGAIDNIGQWNRRLFELGGRKLLGDARNIDLASTVRDCMALARRHGLVRDCSVNVDASEAVNIYGAESTIQRAILNLVLNAADATGPGGQIEVALRSDSDGSVAITVDDNGPGVPGKIRDRIFEPFYTTKASGTGLGLASVAACAQVHGGKVSVTESHLGGAKFKVTLRRPAWGSELRGSAS